MATSENGGHYITPEDVDKPLPYTARLLSQAEGCGVNFYTINFLRLATRKNCVGAHGQRLYNHCLTNLPVHRSGDERLQFGWGETHLLRNAGVQLYEYEHLMLASALVVYFSEEYAAAVLNAISKMAETEERPKPHISSLRGFVHAANGIMALNDFSLTVDDRIRLNPYRRADDGMPFARQPQETIAIAHLGQALSLLGDKVQTDLTFVGGDILGWFSAYADLCLGIDVTLVDYDGKELHRANQGAERKIRLQFAPLLSPPPPGMGHVLSLRDDDMCRPSTTLHTVIHSGRLTPYALLNTTFGAAFHQLDQAEGKVFANGLGGSARFFELAASDQGGMEDVMNAENRQNRGSWGLGLIQTWTNWFPELRHHQGRMERALKMDREAAGKMCTEAMNRLEPLCGCYICSETKGSNENPTNLPEHGFCLPTLQETIIMLGLALSRVALIPNLHPSRAGVLNMYKSQMRKRWDLKASGFLSHDIQRHNLLFGEDWNSTFPKRLANVAALFAGTWPNSSELPENVLGISFEGICAYSMMLERGNKKQPHPDDQVIRVTTGSICWRSRTLTTVCLGAVGDAGNVSWDALDASHFKEKLYVQ